RVRDAGGDALSAPEQDAARGARRLRMAGVGIGSAAEVLQADCEGQSAARRIHGLLETPHHHDQSAGALSMDTVHIINLNGNAFHVEEPGYVALRGYLERAERQLKDNPDKAEITKDLEQAIADKCAHFLSPHKNVITATEMDEVLKQMGPVQGEPEAAAQSGD